MHTFKTVGKAEIRIIPLTDIAAQSVIELATLVHGPGYLDSATLMQWQSLGQSAGVNANFIALANEQLVGYRLSFSAGNWRQDEWCSPELWPVNATALAYFKSVAVHPAWQGLGIGQQLLQQAIAALRQQGAKAGLAHLWRESPHNSAVRYFCKAGGRLLKVHPNRWQHLSAAGYLCPRCGALCCCSAAEMVLEF